MSADRTGQIAVVFASRRNAEDAAGYDAAVSAMEALAAEQPGYRGIASARGADGFGITVSYWADEASVIAWRKQIEHAAIRERGRALWYDEYALQVAEITRSYGWRRRR